ncbi:MAG: MacB-like periplasmic core domain protein [Gemmatimonadetes bacterium]|nr:MacB-like periplasmic core domain protein [Gemmatimonadota bacterium]
MRVPAWISPERVGENVVIALDTLRASKMRSALTILGVVIGVSTVMTMASIVAGLRDQIVHTLEIAGPTTFYVMRVFSQTPLNPDRLPKWVRVRPELVPAEADRISQLPQIQYAGMWAQVFSRVEFGGVRTQQTTVMASDDRFTEIQGGDLTEGRWFTKAELKAGSAVAVLDAGVTRKLFGEIDPLDKWVRISGRPARVIGVYQPEANIFQPPGQEVSAIVPYLMADHQMQYDRTNGLFIAIKPRPGVTVTDAQEAVTVAMREMRRLRPGDHDSFDMMTQDQILDTFNKITGVFFLVMIVLSGVALLVGGIGVMAIMMISVTERTKEIGIRKAIGATQRDIQTQFLVEAATLTGMGGAIGIAIGLILGKLVTMLMSIDASPPLDLTLLAVFVSVSIGLVFGFLPARRAARLDPIDALRYE